MRKTAEAATEEGSLGATVDLRTARPFDYKGFTFAASAQAGYNDLAKKARRAALSQQYATEPSTYITLRLLFHPCDPELYLNVSLNGVSQIGVRFLNLLVQKYSDAQPRQPLQFALSKRREWQKTDQQEHSCSIQ